MPVNEVLRNDLLDGSMQTITSWTEDNKTALTGIAFAYGLDDQLETRLKSWMNTYLLTESQFPEDIEAYLWTTFLKECADYEIISTEGEREKLQVLDGPEKCHLIAYSYGELSLEMTARISQQSEDAMEEELIRSIRYIQACFV